MDLFQYLGTKRISITKSDGTVYIGAVIAVFDKDETYFDEDSIEIQTENRSIFGVFPSEIKNIVVLD